MKPLKRVGLYQSLYLVNAGTEIMMRALYNWRCNPHLPGRNNYEKVILDLQRRRILLNLEFLREMIQSEQVALGHLEEKIHNAAPKA